MSIECGIVKDLLPLYAENLCGGESARAVEAHLDGCEDCRRELDALRAPQHSLQPLATLPLQKLSHKLKRSGWRLTGCVVALVLMCVTVAMYHASARHYVRYEEGLVSVDLEPDGRLRVGASRPAQMEMQMRYTPATNQAEVYVTLFNMQREGAGMYQLYDLPAPDAKVSVYYAYPNEQAVLLMGELDPEGAFFTLPRLALNYYVYLMALALAGLGLLWLAAFKWPALRRRLWQLAALPLSYIVAHLMIKGLNGTSWNMGRDFSYIAVTALFGAAALLLLPALRRPGLADERALKG